MEKFLLIKIGEGIFHSFITGVKAEYVHVDAGGFVDFKVERQGSYLMGSIESQLSMKTGDWCWKFTKREL